MAETQDKREECRGNSKTVCAIKQEVKKDEKDESSILPKIKQQTDSFDAINLMGKQDSKPFEISERKDHNSFGLLYYRKWWERVSVELSVNGRSIKGVPIFLEENTLRVINNDSSYFIPLEKVDYIRTSDGLDACGKSDNVAIGANK